MRKDKDFFIFYRYSIRLIYEDKVIWQLKYIKLQINYGLSSKQ